MAILSRQIGWGTESNLLWQILKQLKQLASVIFSLKQAATPKYKVYTALLSQIGTSDPLNISSGDLTIGVTYYIDDAGGGDFTNVGAPNNNNGTYFVATGTTPNSWGTGANLIYDSGAPIVIVLENTIGNIWWTYVDTGQYSINTSDGTFNFKKTYTVLQLWADDSLSPRSGFAQRISDNQIFLVNRDYAGNSANIIGDLNPLNGFLTSIEIRVYN